MRYADIVLRYVSGDGSARFVVPPEFEEFRVDAGTPHTTMVDWRVGPVRPLGREPDMGLELWDFWRNADGSDLMVFYRTHERLPYVAMRLSADRREVQVVHDPVAALSEVADVGLYPLSEILVARLATGGALVDLHASSVVIDGLAYLFTGHSGAGKTTISEIALALGATVLSDDRTLVGVREGVAIAWGTPWHGTGRRSSSRTAPVGGIFLLRQASADAVTPLAPARAFKELFVRLIHQRLTTAESEGALGALQSLIETAAMWELSFRPTADAVRLALATARATREEEGSLLAPQDG